MGRIKIITSALVGFMLILGAIACNGDNDPSVLKAQVKRSVVSKELISTAEKYIGLEELTGNNDHPQITVWMRQCSLRGDKGYPWCAAAQTGVHNEAGISNPESARVVDWFKQNVTWKREFGRLPKFVDRRGMVGAIYYKKLGRYGHIVLIVRETENNFYTLEGNTNSAGSREGQGFYRKIRSKKYIAALSDYCLSGQDFNSLYDNNIQKQMK